MPNEPNWIEILFFIACGTAFLILRGKRDHDKNSLIGDKDLGYIKKHVINIIRLSVKMEWNCSNFLWFDHPGIWKQFIDKLDSTNTTDTSHRNAKEEKPIIIPEYLG